MSGQTWAYLSGDTSRFAICFALEANPHDPDMALPDTAASWGSFQFWIGGVNLCAHQEQAETIESVHWYLLPLLDWIIANWNPLFHEERLPDPDYPTASAVAHDPRVVMGQLSTKPAIDWWSWWSRHNVQAGRDGGLFPDLSIRRWRDAIEFSWNSQELAGAPADFVFLAPQGAYRVDPSAVAAPLHEAIGQALTQLSSRRPQSTVIADLRRRHQAIATGQSEQVHLERFAWLTGFEGLSDRFSDVWQILLQSLRSAPARLRDVILAADDRQALFLPGTPQAAVLFGSTSPTVSDHDVLQISRILVTTYSPQGTQRGERLDALRSQLQSPATSGRPWEQGYALAAAALEALAVDTSNAVDVRTIIGRLGATIDAISLSDTGIRAITVAGPYHAPTVFLNDQYVDGISEPVQRFSIAHELCHLLIDPDRAQNLGVTSGPWAPLDIEQRANAFAAAFLLPDSGVVQFAGEFETVGTMDTVQALAGRYAVSMLAVIDHLLNIGLIKRFERDRLRALVLARYQ
jgi:Zn-dependent peptidase ImmA (M78 family)